VNFIQRGASVLMEDFNLRNINEEIKKEEGAREGGGARK
jgi:hypothetical protein